MSLLLADKDSIDLLLNRHHDATVAKNAQALERVFSTDGYFIGTDDTEKWSREELMQKLRESESGWDLTDCRERQIYSHPEHTKVAVFFEVVRHEKYGLMRGSGVVVVEGGKWRILQYVLSFSVPNEVVDKTNILELLAQK